MPLNYLALKKTTVGQHNMVRENAEEFLGHPRDTKFNVFLGAIPRESFSMYQYYNHLIGHSEPSIVCDMCTYIFKIHSA